LASPIAIVHVEDRPEEAALTAHALKRGGIECEIERVDTQSAFRRALKTRPDVILSDFTLPTFDGMSALRIAREISPDTPFIFVSGTIGEERAIDALKHGATDYVLKSNLARLAPAILRALDESRARLAGKQAEQRFRDLVQTSQDWIWELDVDYRYVFSSPGVREILGVEPTTIVGCYHTALVHEDDGIVLDGALRQLRADGERSLLMSARWTHADGSVRWLERHALAVVDDHGMLTGFRGTDRDVTIRKRQEDRINRLNRAHVVLSSINTAVLRIRDRTELLREACRITVTQGGYPTVGVLLVDPGTATARTVAVAGENSVLFRDFQVAMRPNAAEFSSLTEQALCTGVPVTCNDLTDASRHVYGREHSLRSGMKAISIWPLGVDGTVIGAMYLYSTETGAFDEEETKVLGQVAGSLSFALQYLEKEGHAEYLTYFDPMTGLARRALFCERLARSLAPDESAGSGENAVFVLDVERLGTINDRYGRHCGDRLLQLLAERLKGVVDDPTRLGYFGNGRFGLRVGGSFGPGAAVDRARQDLKQLTASSLVVDGNEIRLSLRVGAARFPNDSALADGLVQSAELAVKSAKTSGSRFVDYAAEMNADLQHRMTVEQQLRRALEDRQFLLYYQPKIATDSGQVTGVEALLRWQDPEHGLRSPADFIPVLEESGLIIDVGEWVIQQAVADSLDWHQRGLPVAPIAVNVSPLQFRRPEFVDSLLAAMEPLAKIGRRLDIELTESALMDNLDSAAAALNRLRSAGIGIAIDDFGTGYSSLSRLLRVPLDYLKIDRSFVSRLDSTPTNYSVVATIIALARSFGLLAIAEGVETEAELRVLQRLGCAQFQGYFAAKPMPARELRTLLQATGGDILTARRA
jgi:PAS domain S-box-containing protein/diguanylate cyclase (GGDEF)-like protein